MADTAVKHTGSNHSSSVILSKELKPVTVEAKATAPIASSIKLHTDEYRTVAELFRDACHDQTLVQPVSEQENEKLVAFSYTPPESATTSYLVVYAPRLAETRFITPRLPTLDDKTPIAVQSETDGKYRFVDADKVSDIQIQLPAGKIASVISFSRFTALEHDDETLWIAGVGASNQEIKTEEIPQPPTELKEPIKPQQIEHVEIIPHSTPMGKSSSSQSIAESETSTIDSERSVTRKVEPSSLLQLLRKFFFSLWSWLLTPFGFGKPEARTDETVTGDDSSSTSSTGLLTPHERTPLLDVSDFLDLARWLY